MDLRKVNQIAVHNGGAEEIPSVFALCNDGTIWEYWSRPSGWHVLPDVPGTMPEIERLPKEDPDE